MDNQLKHAPTDYNEESISLLDILTVIGQYKGMILVITLGFSLVAVVVSLMTTPVYTAKTLLIPPNQQQSTSASVLAGLNTMYGLNIAAKSQDDINISFMTSEGFQRKIIDRFDLHTRYHAILLIDARQALSAHVRFGSEKRSGIMSIEVDDPDPVFAANMANAFVEELSIYLANFGIREAQQKRVYYENQIKKTQEDLTHAQSIFRETQQKFGLQIPSALADIGIKEIAELHAQIRIRELQLQAMSSFATPQNTEVKKLMTELLAIRSQLSKIEHGSSNAESAQGSLQHGALLAYRNMKVQEGILEGLVKQFVYAKVDESKGAQIVQVLDVATPPERRTSPKRTAMVVSTAMAAFVLGLLIAFARNMIFNYKKNREGQAKLQALSRAWKL